MQRACDCRAPSAGPCDGLSCPGHRRGSCNLGRVCRPCHGDRALGAQLLLRETKLPSLGQWWALPWAPLCIRDLGALDLEGWLSVQPCKGLMSHWASRALDSIPRKLPRGRPLRRRPEEVSMVAVAGCAPGPGVVFWRPRPRSLPLDVRLLTHRPAAGQVDGGCLGRCR